MQAPLNRANLPRNIWREILPILESPPNLQERLLAMLAFTVVLNPGAFLRDPVAVLLIRSQGHLPEPALELTKLGAHCDRISEGIPQFLGDYRMVPATGLEPVRCYSLEPESSASANSATRALLVVRYLQ